VQEHSKRCWSCKPHEHVSPFGFFFQQLEIISPQAQLWLVKQTEAPALVGVARTPAVDEDFVWSCDSLSCADVNV